MLEQMAFRPNHAWTIEPHEHHRLGVVMPEEAALLDGQYARTFHDEGKIICIAGAAMLWRDRAYFWAILSKYSGPYMLALTRSAVRNMAMIPAARLEAIVRADFLQGRKWLELMGFVNETPDGMAQFSGGDKYCLYARFQEGLDG